MRGIGPRANEFARATRWGEGKKPLANPGAPGGSLKKPLADGRGSLKWGDDFLVHKGGRDG